MSKSKHIQPKKTPLDVNHLLFSLVLIAYGFVTVLTPNLKTLDSNGPKFMTLALLNIVVFLFLYFRKGRGYDRWAYGGFFRNPIALAYSLLMVISLLSFTVATNVNESILHFAKIITVFAATWMVSVVIRNDPRSFRSLAMVMSALLIFDSLSVFSEIGKFIDGELVSIVQIKSVYSNKNILAASIFVKMPFAFWLMLYEQKWGRVAGVAILFLSVLATLFLGTRAFYVGIIFLTLAMLLFLGIRYGQTKEKVHLAGMGYSLGMVLAALITYSVVHLTAYPSDIQAYERGVISRFSSIAGTDGGGGRLAAWQRSFNLIKENPLLGVGLGNWKVDVMKQENLVNPNFVYFYKSHNDFIETTAETGIFGGLAYGAIFLLVFLNLLRVMRERAGEERLKFAFIPALGLFCYSFDAFFNFPQDRPEIQALFALYAGAAIALSFRQTLPGQKEEKETAAPSGRWPAKLFALLTACMLVASAYLLIWNFNSLKLQRQIKDEMNRGTLKLTAAKFLSEFPPIPDINVVGEPIAVQKARYLINEKKDREAIEILRGDRSSPWDMRREFFMAMAFNNLGEYDSVMVYARKVQAQKPRFFDNYTLMASVQEKRGNSKEAALLWEDFLATTKDNPRAWVYAAGSNERAGDIPKAYAIIDSALAYLPHDTLIQRSHQGLYQKFKIEPWKEMYQKAVEAFNAKEYSRAAPLFTAFIEKVPDYPLAYELRSFCHYFMQSYEASLEDIANIVKYGGTLKGNVMNLRGINYRYLGKSKEACADFETAMKMGDRDGTNNYNRFCRGNTPPTSRTVNPNLFNLPTR